MKRQLFFMSLLLLVHSFSFGQVQETKTDTSKQSIQQTVLSIIDSVAKLNTKESIGVIKLYSNGVPIYHPDSLMALNDKDKYESSFLAIATIGATTVEKVEINIVEGVVDMVRIITDNEIFEMKDKTRFLLSTSAEFDKGKILFSRSRKKRAIYFDDCVIYLRNIDQTFLPEDKKIELTQQKKYEVLEANIDLNSNLDVRIYSDMLGVFGVSSNGLVQTEVKSKIILTKPTINNIQAGHYIEPFFKFSKFDSRDVGLKITNTQQPLLLDARDRLKLNQLSYVNLGLKMNYYRLRINSNYTEFNLGLGYDFATIIDTKEIKRGYNMLSYYLESLSQFMKNKHFGMTGSAKVMWLISQSTDLDIKRYVDPYLVFDVTLFYFPTDNNSNRLFLRFKEYTYFGTNQSIGFPQLQFGYSSKINFKQK